MKAKQKLMKMMIHQLAVRVIMKTLWKVIILFIISLDFNHEVIATLERGMKYNYHKDNIKHEILSSLKFSENKTFAECLIPIIQYLLNLSTQKDFHKKALIHYFAQVDLILM
jgi:hypothetical protein